MDVQHNPNRRRFFLEVAGGTAELVRNGEDALVVPVGDESALVSAVIGALGDRERTAERVRNARCRVERELSFRARMQKVEGIYEEMMRSYGCVRDGRRWWGR
ncbi:MAG: hypothetical protein EHM78_20640 [Myxococcaceae bacterium]|nr:MAG: hypothetical protein EHM78_20640 [Myxococcaceae bacterium]